MSLRTHCISEPQKTENYCIKGGSLYKQKAVIFFSGPIQSGIDPTSPFDIQRGWSPSARSMATTGTSNKHNLYFCISLWHSQVTVFQQLLTPPWPIIAPSAVVEVGNWTIKMITALHAFQGHQQMQKLSLATTNAPWVTMPFKVLHVPWNPLHVPCIMKLPLNNSLNMHCSFPLAQNYVFKNHDQL